MNRLEQYDTYPVPLARIYYDAEFNCRGWFTLDSVKDLAESIRQRGGGVELKGLDYPVTVQPIADVAGEKLAGFDYRLIAGHRRFRAIETFLQWSQIPATIRSGLSDREARMVNYVENLERKDLNLWEEARGLAGLFPNGGALRVIAKEMKRDTRWVHARLRLLALPEEVQQLAAAGLIREANIVDIASLKTAAQQIKRAQAIIDAKRDRGPKASLEHLNKRHHRATKYRRSKAAVGQMIGLMLDRGITGLPTRVAAWCIGELSDTELKQDIRIAARQAAEVGRTQGGTVHGTDG